MRAPGVGRDNTQAVDAAVASEPHCTWPEIELKCEPTFDPVGLAFDKALKRKPTRSGLENALLGNRLAPSLLSAAKVPERLAMTAAIATDPTSDATLGALEPARREKLAKYVDLLLESAQLFNLTAIVDPNEAWNRHVVESLRLLPLLGPGSRLIDVGSGGGLPGLVLAIARPDLAVTLLEVTQKKARFLEQTGSALGLTNLQVVAERAEIAAARGSAHRESYDIATARAVAPLPVLAELTAPFAKVGGLILAIKGEKAAAELLAAANALWTQHVSHESTVRHPTATILLLRKRAETPSKYPRRAGEPKRNPL